jgi:DNA-binding LacI/PurR family transcriptional regulator
MAGTVADISRIVGCSVATVSRAMSNHGSVSPETREAVFKALRDTGYSLQRSGRRGRPSRMQAARETGLVEILYFRDTPSERVFVDGDGLKLEPATHWPTFGGQPSPNEISGSFHRRLTEAAASELSIWGYKAVLQGSRSLVSADSLAEVNRPDRAGILLMGEYCDALDQFMAQCIHPIVLVDIIHSGRSDVITTDNQMGICQAFDHLYALGHRKIGFVGYCQGVIGFVERFNTFKWKMAEHGLSVVPEWIYEGPNRIGQAEVDVSRILQLPERPTAFVCANDVVALGVIRAAARLGIRIPDQLSVVGFDDDESAALVTPPLTTVRTPIAEIGRQSVRQLMLQIQHPTPPGSRGASVRLTPELVVRESTGPCPGTAQS